jgi:hypothetical protein
MTLLGWEMLREFGMRQCTMPMAESPVTTLFPQHVPTPGRFGCTEAVTNAAEYYFRRPGKYDDNNALKPLELFAN